MILITGFLHRMELRDIISRWLLDRPMPGDVKRLKEIVNFNAVYVGRVLRKFSGDLLSALHEPNPVFVREIRTKGELKDAMVSNPPYLNDRVEKLIARYREHPERYFRESPFAGFLYYSTGGTGDFYVGSARLKRVRRISEKGARRIIDFLFEQVKRKADFLAEERAKSVGIPKSQLVTSSEEMAKEFERAERRIAQDVRNGKLPARSVSFRIEDVAGLKIVADSPEDGLVIDWLNQRQDTEVIEEEVHAGVYNATNLIVRHTPDRDAILEKPLTERSKERLSRRGLNRDSLDKDLRAFVESGEKDLHMEIIVSNYKEVLESEIGRCMHEDRTVNQRLNQRYRGPLAKNVAWLMEYVFAVAIAPSTPDLPELPLKLWIKYLPDYFDEVLKDLFGIPRYREVE